MTEDRPFSQFLAESAEAAGNGLSRCRHGRTEPHGYGLADEPSYDGGEIHDIWLSCQGPEKE